MFCFALHEDTNNTEKKEKKKGEMHLFQVNFLNSRLSTLERGNV